MIGQQVCLKSSDLLLDVENVDTGSQALLHVHTAMCATGLVHQHYHAACLVETTSTELKTSWSVETISLSNSPPACWHWTD